MKYTGPLGKQFTGNLQKSISLMGPARLLVNNILLRLDKPPFNGKGFLIDKLSLPDGSYIVASVNKIGLNPVIRVWIETPENTIVNIPEVEKIVALFFETGLLHWEEFSPFHPLRVYTGSKLESGCFDLPKTFDINTHKYESEVWFATNQNPTTEYPNPIVDFTLDPNYYPSVYSGLTRLAMQGIHATTGDGGVGKRPNKIFQDQNPSPSKHGILKSNRGNYWSIQIQSSTGITAQKLEIVNNDKAQDALLRLRNGEYLKISSDPELQEYYKNILEACVLGASEVTGDIIQIGSPALVSYLMSKGSPIGHSWKFARNKLEFSIVQHRNIDSPLYPNQGVYLEVFTLFTLKTTEIKNNDGTYSLTTIQLETPYEDIPTYPRAGWTNIWRPYGGSNGLYYYPITAPAPYFFDVEVKESIAPIYCYYDKFDKLQIVWYIQHWFEQIDLNNVTSSHTNPAHRWKTDIYGWTGKQYGGFAVQPTMPNREDYFDIYQSYMTKQTDRYISVTETKTKHTGDLDSNFLSGAFTYCNGQEFIDWGYHGVGYPYWIDVQWDYSVGIQHEIYTEQGEYANPSVWSCIIDFSDCEVVHIIKFPGEIKHGRTMGAEGYQSQTEGGLDIYYGNLTCTGTRYGETSVFTPPNCIPADMNLGMTTAAGLLGFVGSILGTTPTMYEMKAEEIIKLKDFRRVYMPNGYLDLPVNGRWSEFKPESIDDALMGRGLQCDSILSYSGDGMYHKEQLTPQILGGYYFTPGLETVFVGGA